MTYRLNKPSVQYSTRQFRSTEKNEIRFVIGSLRGIYTSDKHLNKVLNLTWNRRVRFRCVDAAFEACRTKGFQSETCAEIIEMGILYISI